MLPMRSRQLEGTLTEFVEECAVRLQADLDAGAEVPFELASRSSRGRGAPLYCYRPLTDAFLRERWIALRGLPSHARAVAALECFEGLDRYLLAREALPESAGRAELGRRARRRGAERADAALRALLGDVFAEQSDFTLREERLRGALERLDCSAHASATEVTLLATLHGLTIASPELALAAGLTIARPDALLDVPDGGARGGRRWRGARGCGAPAGGVHHRGHRRARGDRAGRAVLASCCARCASSATAASRSGGSRGHASATGAWGARALGWGGRPHGMLLVSAEQEDELRAFCNLVSRRAPREERARVGARAL